MKWLDALLDRITMYRLLVYYLLALLVAAAVLGGLGVLDYSPLDIILCAGFLTGVCLVSNHLFAKVFKAPINVESAYITALILVLIISPAHELNNVLFMTMAGALAMASKYMLAINRRHIFNPAAVAVALTSFGAGDSATWWVGTAAMLPFVLAGGILLVRRIRRTAMIVWFTMAVIIVTAGLALVRGGDVVVAVQKILLNSAMFFAAFVMLTEPLTSPTTKGKQAWYGVLVGALFHPQIHLLSLYSTPELALLVGNVASYIMGPRVKLFLRLKKQVKLSHDSADFVFVPERAFAYRPGQYMEFTFQHDQTDSRGARRYFTLASSPTEPDVRVGVKFYEPGSSYKRALRALDTRTPIVAAQLGGNFVLPKDPKRKVVFIAGGIGVTPFRSICKYLLDTNQSRPITMLYAARTVEDLVYRDVFEAARQQFGAEIYYMVDSGAVQPPVYHAPITEATIQQMVPDYKERLFYVSGPHGMVVATEAKLRHLGVPRRNIKKDFFSGYA